MPTTRVEISEYAVSPDHYIGGKRVASPQTFEVRSPLDWDWKLADVARGDALTADEAVTRRSPPSRVGLLSIPRSGASTCIVSPT